ncbi:MAG: Uma2 family endonuclease [Leptolyngbyaceae cyanobacterium]
MKIGSDRLPSLRAKMQEYLDSRLQLDWLINPQDHQADGYRPNSAQIAIDLPTTLPGEAVLPGFERSLCQQPLHWFTHSQQAAGRLP